MSDLRPNDEVGGATVDITNCDREPIHISGGIQPFGGLIAVSADWIVTRCSANILEFTGKSPESILGGVASDVLDDEAIHAIRSSLQWLQVTETNERLFGIALFGTEDRYDLSIHMSDEQIIIEFEPCSTTHKIEPVQLVRAMMAKLDDRSSIDDFYRQAARNVRFITEFDRVMVYRFLQDGTGEVAADACGPNVESYLGLRYPASDIPKQARALYLRNSLRIIADVDAKPSPIVPQLSPEGEPLDLSMSTLRAVSPIHLEYLRNMGVRASMSISIIVDGELWGLFACHNLTPKTLSYDKRTVAELFGQMFSLELANRQRRISAHQTRDARAVHDKIMATMSVEGSVFDNLSDVLDTFQEVISADGAAIWVDGAFAASGRGLTQDEMQGLIRFLNRTGASRIYATDGLSRHYEPAADYSDRVAGILAIPVSRKPRDYLILTRAETARSVTWAGNPDKPASLGPNGIRLTPRKSFEAWREIMRGTSAPWTPAELELAESLRTTLLEVILRSVDENNKLRSQAQATQDLLIAELNHRVRNILTLVRGIVQQAGENSASVIDFATEVGGRIQALARAHDQLTADNWEPSSLRTMLTNEVSAYLGDKAKRVSMTGPNVLLEHRAFTTLALVLHELVTNSAKYGALSNTKGRIDVVWSIDDTGSLSLSWQETGGPPVQAPKRRGFGSTIIERSVPFELHGEADIDFAVAGLQASFLIPGQFVSETQAAEEPAAQSNGTDPMPSMPIRGHALLVEDNVVIAIDIEDMLQDIGFDTVTIASSVATAMNCIEQNELAFAVLDINLGDETSIPVAETLKEQGVPFVFASGYGESAKLPSALEGQTVLTKPYSKDDLLRVMAMQRDGA